MERLWRKYEQVHPMLGTIAMYIYNPQPHVNLHDERTYLWICNYYMQLRMPWFHFLVFSWPSPTVYNCERAILNSEWVTSIRVISLDEGRIRLFLYAWDEAKSYVMAMNLSCVLHNIQLVYVVLYCDVTLPFGWCSKKSSGQFLTWATHVLLHTQK